MARELSMDSELLEVTYCILDPLWDPPEYLIKIVLLDHFYWILTDIWLTFSEV